MTKKTVTQSLRILKVRKDRQYDCVYLHGKKIILGRTGTAEAENAYRKLQVQVLTDPTLLPFKPLHLTVDDLCLAYLQHDKEENIGHFSAIKN